MRRFRRPLVSILLLLAVEALLLLFLGWATGYDRARMWSIFLRVSVGFFSAVLVVFVTPKWLMRRLVRILFNLVAACLVFLVATGTLLLFSDGLDLRVAVWSKYHTFFGFAFALPVGIYLGIHVWREVMSSRGGERWVGGVAAVALLVAIVTGSSLLLGPGAEGVSRYGMVHVVASYLAVGLIAWHLLRAARGATRKGVAARPRARRYPGPLEVGLWGVLCAIGMLRMEGDVQDEASRLAHSEGPQGTGHGVLEPAPVRSATEFPLSAYRLAPAMEGCGRDRGCHVEITERWERSAHAQSSTNPFYRAVVAELVRERGMAEARTCAACHDPVALLAGQLPDGDAYPAATDYTGDGVTCQVCHSIVAGDPDHGNGSYAVQLPEPVLYEGVFEGVEEKINYNVTKLRPQFHAQAYSPEFLDSAESCGVCHGLSKTRAHGELNFQDTYASWHRGRAQGRVDQSCRDCHMPMVRAGDTAGVDGWVHDHSMPGSNGMLRLLAGDRSRETHRFRKETGRFRVELSWVEGRVEARVTAPGVGHTWPGGVSDVTQTWLEIEGWDGAGQRVVSSGGILEGGRLSADALRFGIRLAGSDGERLDRHEVWKADHVIPLRRILPGEAEEVRWNPGPVDAVRYRARLLSRRYGVDFLEHADVSPGRAPVVELARAEIEVTQGDH